MGTDGRDQPDGGDRQHRQPRPRAGLDPLTTVRWWTVESNVRPSVLRPDGGGSAESPTRSDSQSRFEVYRDRAGEWRWRLRHRNGNILADSGEGYARRHNALQAIQAVKRDASGGMVTVIGSEADLAPKGEPFQPVEEGSSRATFDAYTDTDGRHRWRLRHDNGHVLAASASGFGDRAEMERSIARVRAIVGSAPYLRVDPTAFEVSRDPRGDWGWRFVHRDGTSLAEQASYPSRDDAVRAIDRLRGGIADGDPEVVEDKTGGYRWRIRGSAGSVLVHSGAAYSSRSVADSTLAMVEKSVPDSDVLTVERGAIEVFVARTGEHRWRLRDRAGTVLAESGEGYPDDAGVCDAIEMVKRSAQAAGIEEYPSG